MMPGGWRSITEVQSETTRYREAARETLRKVQRDQAHPPASLFFILLLLALILAGCRAGSSTATAPAPAATPTIAVSLPTQTPMPTILENGWFLYTDPEGEFSFAYPPTALISAGQNPVDLSKNITIQFLIPEKPYQGMSIRVEPNPKKLQGANLAQQLFEKSAQKPAAAEFMNSLQAIQVDGVPAVQAHIPSANTELTVIIAYDVQAFFVSPVHELAMTQVEKETLDLFYQILDTLKFGPAK